LKGKVYGAIEALADSLQVMTNDEVLITVIYKEVGIVTENDVNAAIASKAMIVAFNTLIDNNARILAKREGIIIKQYNIIYDVLDDVVVAIKSMNEPIFENVITGTAEVRQIFKISKLGSVAGLYVTEGHISRNGMINVLRKGEDIGTFSVKTLKRFKDDAKQVEAGFECAILLDGFDDFQEGDIIKSISKVKKEK
jgi:translation initiation factor IF-2